MLFLKSIPKKIDRQLEGAALQMVVIIALIITIICSSLLLLTYYKGMNFLHFAKQERMQRNLKSAITLTLSKYFDGADSLLSGGVFGSDSVAIQKEQWGMYELITVKVFNAVDTIKKSYLIGRIPNQTEEVLYIADEDRPLSISGDSKITGDVYLPKAGIRSAYVEGKYYEKNKPLIYGKQLNSTRSIPAIDLANFKKIFEQLEQQKKEHKSGASLSELASFFAETQIIHDQVIKINESYSGKFIFIADSLIEVSESAKLENVIVCAPIVHFLSGNKSNVQIFSRDSVILQENVTLSYPSVIGMYRGKAKQNVFSKIKFAKNSSFEGVILARGEDENYLKYIVELEQDCHLKGLVDIDGTFNYTVPASFEAAIHAKRMVCKLKGVLYENYLIDLKLNIQERPVSFLGSSITDQGGNKKLLKWLQ